MLEVKKLCFGGMHRGLLSSGIKIEMKRLPYNRLPNLYTVKIE